MSTHVASSANEESTSIDVLPPGSFHASGGRPLDADEIVGLLREAAAQAMPGDGETLPALREETALQFAAALRGVDRVESINSWTHLVGARVNREQWKTERPETGAFADGVAHIARAKIALAMHPEKVEALADLLREAGLEAWNVNTFRVRGWIALKHWFANNVRAADGTIDWYLVAEKVNEYYPCEFSLKRVREPFTQESALGIARSIADDAVKQRGHWHPAADLEECDKNMYLYLTSRAHFRRDANRPDIEHRKTTRPNWYKIAEAMGPQYVATMVMGPKGNEPLFRDFPDAVDELGDLLTAQDSVTWSWSDVEEQYAALYRWFTNHVRTEDGFVDTKRIIAALPDPWNKRYWQNEDDQP